MTIKEKEYPYVDEEKELKLELGLLTIAKESTYGLARDNDLTMTDEQIEAMAKVETRCYAIRRELWQQYNPSTVVNFK